MYQFEIWRKLNGGKKRKEKNNNNTENYQVFLKNASLQDQAMSCNCYAEPAMVIELWHDWSLQYPELWSKREHFIILTVHLWDESIYCHGWDGGEPTCNNNQIILRNTNVSETTCSKIGKTWTVLHLFLATIF